jgi:hypothetical protein
MLYGLIGPLAAAIAYGFVFVMLRRLVSGHAESPPGEDDERIGESYRRWMLVAFLLWFVAAIGCAVVIWGILVRFGQGRFADLPSGDVAIIPDGVVWAFPAFFAGMIAAVYPVELVLRLILRERFIEFESYESRKLGFNVERAAGWASLIMTGGCVLSVAMIADWYIVVGRDAVRIDGFFSPIERVYPFEEVAEIQTAPRFRAPIGKVVDRREYVIAFRDGRSWSTRWTPFESADQKTSVAEVISERSGVSILELDILGN